MSRVDVIGRSVRVRVPASSANLGPGFDTFGLALALYDEVEVTAVAGPSRVEVSGVGAGEVPEDEQNLVVRAAARAFGAVGVEMPGLHLRAQNVIPHGSGLGSSAAAIVSGLVAANALLDAPQRLGTARLLELATEMEGHPDNVASALLGGLTIAWSVDDVPRAKQLSVHRGVYPLACVPSFSVSTEHARSLQPASVPYEDAVFNLSRSALLVAALVQSPELLLEATEDRLHQDYRADAMPLTRDLVLRLRDAGHAAVVSGAGPSVLVLAPDPARRVEAAALVAEVGSSVWSPHLLAVDVRGATVFELPVSAAD